MRVRVVDESGEDYLYPADYFVAVNLPREAERALTGAARFRRTSRVKSVLAAVVILLYRALGLASGCFVFCTRDAFRAAGGFDEKLFAAEEAALSGKHGRLGTFAHSGRLRSLPALHTKAT